MQFGLHSQTELLLKLNSLTLQYPSLSDFTSSSLISPFTKLHLHLKAHCHCLLKPKLKCGHRHGNSELHLAFLQPRMGTESLVVNGYSCQFYYSLGTGVSHYIFKGLHFVCLYKYLHNISHLSCSLQSLKYVLLDPSRKSLLTTVPFFHPSIAGQKTKPVSSSFISN